MPLTEDLIKLNKHVKTVKNNLMSEEKHAINWIRLSKAVLCRIVLTDEGQERLQRLQWNSI